MPVPAKWGRHFFGEIPGHMKEINNILLASHGTDGAVAAEEIALSLCSDETAIHQLVVVPSLWKGMTGDDWLNNGSTRNRFCDYLESELEKEVNDNLKRVMELAEAQGITYTHEVVVGEPQDVLLKCSEGRPFDLVVIGSPRPKGKSGLRSRMKLDPLAQSLTMPLMIVPYPDE